jgi:hypothetical protein
MKKRTYTDKPLGDTEYLLEQWGSWRMSGMGVPRYVSQLASVIAQANPCDDQLSYVITDDAAMVVDSIIARLIKRNQQMGDFVWLYYGSKWTSARIGEKYGMAERKAREIIKQGVAWVDSALESFREAA